MSRKRLSKYVWPSSGLTEADMAALHAVRESSRPRIPISVLIAAAIRAQYGHADQAVQQPESIATLKVA